MSDFKMADEIRSPAKKRRKTENTGLNQRDEPETQKELVKPIGKSKTIIV